MLDFILLDLLFCHHFNAHAFSFFISNPTNEVEPQLIMNIKNFGGFEINTIWKPLNSWTTAPFDAIVHRAIVPDNACCPFPFFLMVDRSWSGNRSICYLYLDITQAVCSESSLAQSHFTKDIIDKARNESFKKFGISRR